MESTDDVLRLKLARACTVARQLARVTKMLLHQLDAQEEKKEAVAQYITTAERDLDALMEEKAAQHATPAEHARMLEPITKRLLSDADRERLSSHPSRSYALTVKPTQSRPDLANLRVGLVVEVLCRFPDGTAKVRHNGVVGLAEQRDLVVLQEGSGIPWAMATVRAVRAYAGRGPELTYAAGATMDVVKVNNSTWWKGLMGPDAVAGLFPCQTVEFVRIYSGHMEKLLRSLQSACKEMDTPTAKLKLLMGATLFDRGAEEFTAIQTKAWVDCKGALMPVVFPSTCCLRFTLDDGDHCSVTQTVRFKCPDNGGAAADEPVPGALVAAVLAPKLGPNLLDKVSVVVEPSEFRIAANGDADVQVTLTLEGDIDAAFSIIVPVVFRAAAGKGAAAGSGCRYFLYCDVATSALRFRDRASVLLDDQDSVVAGAAAAPASAPRMDSSGDVRGSSDAAVVAEHSEVWGETMSSKDLGVGMKDLLSELLVMPPDRKQRPQAPPRGAFGGVAPREGRSATAAGGLRAGAALPKTPPPVRPDGAGAERRSPRELASASGRVSPRPTDSPLLGERHKSPRQPDASPPSASGSGRASPRAVDSPLMAADRKSPRADPAPPSLSSSGKTASSPRSVSDASSPVPGERLSPRAARAEVSAPHSPGRGPDSVKASPALRRVDGRERTPSLGTVEEAAPSGALTAMRLRLGRNRSGSSGDEASRKSPRSPRDKSPRSESEATSPRDNVVPVPARPPASQQDGAPPTGAAAAGRGKVLERSASSSAVPPSVRLRDSPSVERRAGWVSSVDRRANMQRTPSGSDLLQGALASSSGAVVAAPSPTATPSWVGTISAPVAAVSSPVPIRNSAAAAGATPDKHRRAPLPQPSSLSESDIDTVELDGAPPTGDSADGSSAATTATVAPPAVTALVNKRVTSVTGAGGKWSSSDAEEELLTE